MIAVSVDCVRHQTRTAELNPVNLQNLRVILSCCLGVVCYITVENQDKEVHE